jgi:hypothetical protein
MSMYVSFMLYQVQVLCTRYLLVLVCTDSHSTCCTQVLVVLIITTCTTTTCARTYYRYENQVPGTWYLVPSFFITFKHRQYNNTIRRSRSDANIKYFDTFLHLQVSSCYYNFQYKPTQRFMHRLSFRVVGVFTNLLKKDFTHTTGTRTCTWWYCTVLYSTLFILEVCLLLRS